MTLEDLDDLGYGDDFLNTSKAWPVKEIISWTSLKLKTFALWKKRVRRQATDWENIYEKDKSDKGQLFKIYKKVLKLNYYYSSIVEDYISL